MIGQCRVQTLQSHYTLIHIRILFSFKYIIIMGNNIQYFFSLIYLFIYVQLKHLRLYCQFYFIYSFQCSGFRSAANARVASPSCVKPSITQRHLSQLFDSSTQTGIATQKFAAECSSALEYTSIFYYMNCCLRKLHLF